MLEAVNLGRDRNPLGMRAVSKTKRMIFGSSLTFIALGVFPKFWSIRLFYESQRANINCYDDGDDDDDDDGHHHYYHYCTQQNCLSQGVVTIRNCVTAL